MTAVAPSAAVPVVRTPLADKPLGWWGTLGVIATEGTLFALLLFVYFFLRANNHPWPPSGIARPELVKSSIRSVILIASSVPVALAERALKRGDVRRFRRLVIVTMFMGAIFLVGHAMEYLDLSKTFTPTTNSYGSVFFTITGLHAVHLFIGLLILGYLVVQSLRGRYDEGGSPNGVVCGILYWHFVDAVWLAVFASLYLSERI
jgi:heme/copper-type cytochrome/quinol oxidase subunit 3